MKTALEFSVEQLGEFESGEDLFLSTPGGKIRCRLHGASSPNAVVWVFGAGGGLGGPAGGLYERLARVLQPERVASLQIAYRHPGAMRPCVEDALTGSAFLQSVGAERVVLVGHSFGGAVVINAGAADPAVIAVAALSSQSHGAVGIARLSPKPLMLMHGEADEVLPPTCSVDLYRAAREPKELRLYRGCRHGLDQCRDEIDRDLADWLHQIFGIVREQTPPA